MDGSFHYIWNHFKYFRSKNTIVSEEDAHEILARFSEIALYCEFCLIDIYFLSKYPLLISLLIDKSNSNPIDIPEFWICHLK